MTTQEPPTGPNMGSRPGWMTALVAISVVLAALFILYLVLAAVGMFD